MKSKGEVNKICNVNYDRFWSGKISQSPKAASFIKFKTNISTESHLNITHKKAISRCRLSNHPLMIEKGSHLKIDKHERKCKFLRRQKGKFSKMSALSFAPYMKV